MITCPKCDIALTRSEVMDAKCPSCGAALAVPVEQETFDEPMTESPPVEPGLSETRGFTVAMTVLGVVILLGGMALFFGNRSGLFMTFPYAGTLMMIIGSAVMGLGKYVGSGTSR